MISPLLECVKGMDGLRSEWVNNSFFIVDCFPRKHGRWVWVEGGVSSLIPVCPFGKIVLSQDTAVSRVQRWQR